MVFLFLVRICPNFEERVLVRSLSLGVSMEHCVLSDRPEVISIFGGNLFGKEPFFPPPRRKTSHVRFYFKKFFNCCKFSMCATTIYPCADRYIQTIWAYSKHFLNPAKVCKGQIYAKYEKTCVKTHLFKCKISTGGSLPRRFFEHNPPTLHTLQVECSAAVTFPKFSWRISCEHMGELCSSKFSMILDLGRTAAR